jgi:hypothetical protein
MISHLASPSVCVIDDEEADFRPILNALNGLYVSSVHILGTVESLPPGPFRRLRLVFLDLHLSGTVGKDAASYTANAFTKIVSPETAPIVVVIWSKYAKDKVAEDNVPAEDQETEAELFKRTLLGAEPNYNGRLIFVEMEKPKQDGRPGDWTEVLKTEIENALRDQSAIEVLWSWDSLVKDGCTAVSEGLTSVAQAAVIGTDKELKDGLKATMQRLAKAQGEGDLSPATAPNHLVSVLTQLLMDQLEHTEDIGGLSAHGSWLSEEPVGAAGPGFAAHMNGLLLTAAVSGGATPYIPGTVYEATNLRRFCQAFGVKPSALINSFHADHSPPKPPALNNWRAPLHTNHLPKLLEWRKSVRLVAVEISPVCDVAQKKRHTNLLIAGVLVPAAKKKEIQRNDPWVSFPASFLRWPLTEFPAQDVILVVCHRFKASMVSNVAPSWLQQRFRLREMPTASIRNQQSSYAARVGYVSVNDK